VIVDDEDGPGHRSNGDEAVNAPPYG
jgi:hypothetical protein